MVKVGSNLSEKPDKEQGGGDDGFDNIPLITPLDVNQLQQPFPDKVIVKTRTEYQLQQKKKRKLHVPGIKKLNINLYDEVSEKVKLLDSFSSRWRSWPASSCWSCTRQLWYDQPSAAQRALCSSTSTAPRLLWRCIIPSRKQDPEEVSTRRLTT
ncbi:neuronal vesicle trafficking-associated protein 1 isoform X2 [Ornithorhynchus anatinus]|nr:neuronal vesicle trafficking-associated protein 1 isoform X2 [Ornithorhynchus anatinus]